jgi:hypothetical protein
MREKLATRRGRVGGLKRGGWLIEPTDSGFRLTVRSRPGVETWLVGIVSAVFAAQLVLVAVLFGRIAPEQGLQVIPPALVLVGAVLLVAFLPWSSLAWLVNGRTVIDYDGVDLRISYPGHWWRRPKLIVGAKLDTLRVSRTWLAHSVFGYGIVLGAVEGPLLCESWDGFPTLLGGDISLATAAEIVDAVRARRVGEVSTDRQTRPRPVEQARHRPSSA